MIELGRRHCERSEAIQLSRSRKAGLLRRFAPRNDGGASCDKFDTSGKSVKTRQPLAAKIFRFTILKIRIITIAVSSPRRGVGHRHHTLGWDAVDAWVQARVDVQTTDRVRRSRVVLAPRCWRQACGKLSASDGDNKPAHRGEHEVSRKAIAQGMSECFRSPVCSCAPNAQFLAHETAGAACTRHSLRPLFREGQRIGKSSGKTCRENASTRHRPA